MKSDIESIVEAMRKEFFFYRMKDGKPFDHVGAHDDAGDWLRTQLRALTQKRVDEIEGNKLNLKIDESDSDWFYGYGFNAGLQAAIQIVKGDL